MRNIILLAILTILSGLLVFQFKSQQQPKQVLSEKVEQNYWFLLSRKSNKEILFLGEPGNREKSEVVKKFNVKSGIPGERPTPLPKLLGRDYWLITNKFDTKDSPETAPYFLTLDIPYTDEFPYGPTPYLECGGGQCDWILLGSFGLHGTAGNPEKLSEEDPGSSGCIRHSDEDITYLYNLLDPSKMEIRYYIEDI